MRRDTPLSAADLPGYRRQVPFHCNLMAGTCGAWLKFAVVPPYLQGIRSKTPSGWLRPRIGLNPCILGFSLDTHTPMLDIEAQYDINNNN